MSDVPPWRLSSPQDLLAAIPYLIGFQPQDSAVAIGLDGTKIAWIFRADLDAPAEAVAKQAIKAATYRVTTPMRVILAAYASAPAARPITHIRSLLKQSGVETVRCLRVHEGRFYCLDCVSCPEARGIAFDSSTTAVAAAATLAGLVALPTRSAVVAMAAPDAVAQQRIEKLLSEVVDALGPPDLRRDQTLIDDAFAQARDGLLPNDQQAAMLAVVLQQLPVRDHAWLATDDHPWQLDLWMDLTRRTPEPLVAPVASLAAWSAWRAGDSVLAGTALDRVNAADPSYSLATAIRDLVNAGLPPKDVVPQWPLPDVSNCCLMSAPESDLLHDSGQRDSAW